MTLKKAFRVCARILDTHPDNNFGKDAVIFAIEQEIGITDRTTSKYYEMIRKHKLVAGKWGCRTLHVTEYGMNL